MDLWVQGLSDPEFQDSQDQRKTLSGKGAKDRQTSTNKREIDELI